MSTGENFCVYFCIGIILLLFLTLDARIRKLEESAQPPIEAVK